MTVRVFLKEFAVVSPIGTDAETFERNLFEGVSGVRENTCVSGRFPVRAVGWIHGYNRTPSQPEIVSRLLDQLKERIGPLDGIVFHLTRPSEFELHGLGLDLATAPLLYQNVSEQGKWLLSQLRSRCDRLPDERNCISIAEACITGTSAIGIAAQRIQSKCWRRALVIVSELRASPVDILRFHALGALSTRSAPPESVSCPFSLDRDGFVLSEGGGALILEAETSSPEGTPPLAEVAGFGQTSDAWRLTEGRPDGSGPAAAMRAAIRAAEIPPTRIDCICAHGTSTKLNDHLETIAVKNVFGDRAPRIPITALKSQIGHTANAAGMLQTIAATIMLQRQEIPATINLRSPDPNCDLDYVPGEPRRQSMEYILSNGFAFGGVNASLVLRRAGRGAP